MPYIGQSPTQSAFVTDTFSGNGSTTAFTMSVAPAGTSSVLVAVSGVLQDPSTYSVSGTTLTFSGAPPSGTSNISARYLGIPASGVTTTAYRTVTEFTATAGQTTFTPPSYTAGFINVYRNGILLGSADYVATNGTTVVLTTGATLNDLVTVESFLVSSVLNAIPNTAASVSTSNLTDGSISTAKLADGSITQAKLSTNIAGNGPAFSAYLSANQTPITNGTFTKVRCNIEEFDTASAYDNATNYRFTPQVAGYYQVNGSVNITSATNSEVLCVINKNDGSVTSKWGNYLTRAATANDASSVVSALIYLNGTTDYVELFAYINGTGTLQFIGSLSRTYFQASMVRAA
jgi:hypothetical protein